AIIPKIVEGKMEKFYGDTCLLEQVYIKDPDGKLKVRDVLKQAGGGASINRFVRYQLGEGIEKKQGNFAEEVAAQLK
ncbi:MAG TPA: elongation factor Ts, partial [Nitrospiraceae bacterium]|nr:elongation factor Ts [Nitrospiraceae bacterium]